VVLPVLKIQKSTVFFSGAENDIASFTPVSSIWPATRHEFFSSEAYAALTSMPGFDINFCLINKFHRFLKNKKALSVKRLE
jgi:hypothetical protein